MKHWCFLIVLCGFIILVQSCGFFNDPETFGELHINIRFAGDNSAATAGKSLPKENSTLAPQAVDRIVVIVREYVGEEMPNRLFDRVVVRKEIRLGNNRQLREVIEVPLQNAGVNYFDLRIEAFDRLALLYSGGDILFFDEKNRRVTANVLLEPTAFRLFTPPVLSTGNRLITLSGQADTSVKAIEIVADSVSVKFPLNNNGLFSNPVMLFGNNTLVRVIASRGQEDPVETSRQVVYTGLRSDILVALAWDQPLDLNLEIANPLQQIITVGNLGDDAGGRLLQSDQDGYGPEVFEWRANSALQRGLFVVRVARPRLDIGKPASGKVYIFLGEKQNLPDRRILRFSFGLQDIQLPIDNILIQ